MTTEELQNLVGNVVTSVAANSEAIDNLRVATDANAAAIGSLRATIVDNERINTAALRSFREAAESQARSIEAQRKTISANTQIMADAIQLSAIAQRSAAAVQETAAIAQRSAAAAALELSANTSRNIDRLEQTIEILIKDNQADRSRIRHLEDRTEES
jgi:hypothetical protein